MPLQVEGYCGVGGPGCLTALPTTTTTTTTTTIIIIIITITFTTITTTTTIPPPSMLLQVEGYCGVGGPGCLTALLASIAAHPAVLYIEVRYGTSYWRANFNVPGTLGKA
jgi:hypothetical protein